MASARSLSPPEDSASSASSSSSSTVSEPDVDAAAASDSDSEQSATDTFINNNDDDGNAQDNDDDDIFEPSRELLASGPRLSHLLSSLRRASLSPRNRLLSIRDDARFVERVQRAFAGPWGSMGGEERKSSARPARPLVANERCGSWYVDPARKAAGAYFKSTDGHTGVWKFSARRLNLHLLELVERHDGCIIVDSTRRGKRMPDALSKTIPLWCAVVNRTLFPPPALSPAPPPALLLHTPPNVVSASEHAAMAALVPGFCDAFAALGIDFASLRRVLTKPLRPVWVTPDSVLPGEGGSGGDDDNEDDSEEEAGVVFKDFRPIICCTASRRTLDPEAADDDGGATRGYAYVQGAADDTENWAAGLTAPLFWAYRERLLDFATTRSDAELLALIADVVEAETKRARGGLSLSSLSPPSSSSSAPKEDDDDDGDRKRAGPGVFVTTLAALPRAPRDGECHVVLLDDGPATPQEEWAVSHSRIEVRLGRHKTANKNLRHALPEIMAFVARFLARLGRETHDAAAAVVFACASATDLSVGAALAALCWFESSDERGLRPPRDDASASSTPARMSKDVVNVRRAAVMMALPHANPSRATLQSVNSFLMDWRRR